MSGNTFKETAEEPVSQPKEQKRSSKAARNFIRFMNLFGVLDRNQVVRAMPFILYVTLLIIGYIANSYYAEGLIRKINKTAADCKEKRAEFISSKFDWMNSSQQSHVAKALEPLSIKENTKPPISIVVHDKEDAHGSDNTQEQH